MTVPRDTTEGALRACEAALRRAQLTSDVAVLDRLVDDALVFVGPNALAFSHWS